MFMIAGGHFAGIVARVSPPQTNPTTQKKPAQGAKKPDMEIILHKTFHRYTSKLLDSVIMIASAKGAFLFAQSIARRKQGGSQSANDNAKGPAKSAGALLRRYGEQALRDVRCVKLPLHIARPFPHRTSGLC
jgi:hypothetical protein